MSTEVERGRRKRHKLWLASSGAVAVMLCIGVHHVEVQAQRVDVVMYEAFYGFRERPFDLTPNPRFLLLTGKHREALSNLQYGLTSRRGLTLLVGDAGTGKTTLIRAVIQDYEKQGALIAYLNNPTLTRPEFYEFLTRRFGLSARAATSKTALLAELAQVLERRQAGRSDDRPGHRRSPGDAGRTARRSTAAGEYRDDH